MNIIYKTIILDEFIYNIGYRDKNSGDSTLITLSQEDIFPYINIYKNNTIIGTAIWNVVNNNKFFFSVDGYIHGYVQTSEEIFNKLRAIIPIPENVEEEFESLYLLCKLNDFKKL